MRQRPTACLLFVLALAGCSAGVLKDGTAQVRDDDLTSVGGVTKQIDWESFVYVATDADAGVVQQVIARQVKSSLGSLRELGIGISDRGALHNLDPAGWTRELVNVIDASTGRATGPVQRVRYHYRDTALVQKSQDPGAAVSFTMLFGDYVSGSAALQPACVDEATDGDSLWYHFAPRRSACARAITTETATINADLARLPPASPSSVGQMPLSDAQRRFVGVRAKLTPIVAAPVKYPEYDRLWGFGSDRQKVVVYAFVGVESNERDSHDLGAIEFQRLLRTLRGQFGGKLQVTATQPFALLLDFYVDGNKLDGVTFDDVARWMIDGTGYPAAVGSDAQKIEALKQQVIDRFSERWIYWTVPATVTLAGQTRQMTVELRTFWGKEDGDADSKQHAEWRYLEAFWHGDVFAYAGHSHFGHGPLEPTNYSGANFPDRYQVMLVNSCLSYNYYDLDFIQMHAGGSRNLDVVMNGLPAYWNGMGESTAKYLVALLDGTNKSWSQLLDAMRIDLAWGERGYEPMRGVNGELDNSFDGSRAPITVAY
ncbi:MAG: hypothetical protein JWN44_2899 [Myxococcales bacterium]|nr:hypothetical protein [Myxococcales bacterium]